MSTSMQRVVVTALVMSVFSALPAIGRPLSLSPDSQNMAASPAPAEEAGVHYVANAQPNLGGGFIEFLFGGGASRPGSYAPPSDPTMRTGQPVFVRGEPVEQGEPARPAVDPRFDRQVVEFDGNEPPGTIVIDTRERLLFLVQSGGRALRYGIGVGRPGFSWAGVKEITMKREWPDWRPPDDMLKRRPDLPRYMPGGPENPLGARALYLGSSLYRIHGSNEPWTIGTAVSSGCIRMRNEDVIDLYDRVRVGTKVIVI